MKFILGKKLGMTTIFNDAREAQNVTLVECSTKVSLLRNEERDGYVAVQVEMAKTKNKVFRKEFKADASEMKIGDEVSVDSFKIGDKVSISGLGKAKGFQGGVKRYGFGGGNASHGGKHNLRQPGSIGASYPEHVIKGKRMAGRMGGKRVTSEKVKVVFIDKEKNIMALKGPVPGAAGTMVEIYQRQ